MLELARQMSIEDTWLCEDAWEALQKSLTDAFENGSVHDLLDGKVMKLKSRMVNEYQTPSGKMEFYSSRAIELGLNPLPEQLRVEQSEEGWYTLLNSSLPNYTHSQFTDVYGPIPQIVWINSEDSENIQMEDGEVLEVFNDLGKVTLRATVTDKVSPGVLWVPRPVTGMDGNPMNSLASSKPQTIGRGPTFNTTRVKVRRIKQE